MNSPADDNQDLAALFRRASPPLADAGFSQRVVAALPPRRRRRDLRQLAWCAIGAFAGIAFAASRGALSAASLAEGGSELGRSLAPMLEIAANPHVLVALVVTGFSVAFALLGDIRVLSRRK